MALRSGRLGWLGLSVSLAIAGCGGSSGGDEDGGVTADTGTVDGGRRDGDVDSSTDDAGPPAEECPDGCLVGGTCFPDGVLNPTNLCQICDAALAPTGFSPNDGGLCDDGVFCTTNDACSAGACAGTPRVCDDGIACNGVAMCTEGSSACEAGTSTCALGQICDALSGACVLECTGCLIAGTCYGDRQLNALNPCQVCSVASSRTGWSANDGASCDDGLFCTIGDVCAASACSGDTARACDDGVACDGTETCDETANVCAASATPCTAAEICDIGTDACVATCTGCVISGMCYGAGQRNPANQCEVCAVATSRSAWSANGGASCDDGAFCTEGDVCTGTSCGGPPRDCGDAIACNGSETCNETSDSCAAGTSACTAGSLCDTATDACVRTCSGCVIAGSCYGAGQVNPANSCEVCAVGTSRVAWSDNDGARCDDGSFCTDGDTCGAGVCAGSARVCTDGVSCNGTEACNETADSCISGTSTCAGTEICNTTSDTCVTTCAGCVIGGVCYANGTRNPANACELCDTVRSRSAFSANDGASCDDGAFCTTGDVCSGGLCAGSSTANFCADGVTCNGTETCNEASDRCSPGATTCAAGEVCNPGSNTCVTACSGCVIGGVCYASATRNPTNQCQICTPASSATAWSPNGGASCDDGLFCTAVDTCDASAVCGGTTRSCADAVTCNGTETCNEGSDRCDTGASICGAGQVCDAAANACVITCSGCAISGVCQAAGAINPANPCQSCQIATATTAWSPRTGATCDDGLFCTDVDTCDASAVCGGTMRICSDGVTCNGTETCNETGNRCSSGTTTCGAGQVCDTTSDTCWTCIPGAYVCIDVNTRWVCNSDGLTHSSAACSGGAIYGYSCTGAGSCTDRVCAPGTASSVCASATARQVCNADGLASSVSSCTTEQSCAGGICAVRCADGILAASESCDDGNVVNGDGCSDTCQAGSCAGLLAARPGMASGTYSIDPDGSGSEPSISVFCDMTTMGGGWTLIFVPTVLNYISSSLDYTVASTALRTASSETMVAYRNLDALALATSPYRFAIPANWRTQSPLRYPNVTEAVTVTAASGATTTTTLTYGYENWGGDVAGASCPAAWLAPSNSDLGRVCIAGTTAPAYWSFADVQGDFCGNSSGHWSTGTCARTAEFTIAVR